MKLFVFIFVIFISWNFYKSVDISGILSRDKLEEFLEQGQKEAEKDFCPEGQKPRYGYIGTGWGFLDCYVPKNDFGKICFQESDCQSGQCLVENESIVEKKCKTRIESQSYICTEISGKCTDGGTIETGLYITTKNHVLRKKFY